MKNPLEKIVFGGYVSDDEAMFEFDETFLNESTTDDDFETNIICDDITSKMNIKEYIRPQCGPVRVDYCVHSPDRDIRLNQLFRDDTFDHQQLFIQNSFQLNRYNSV